MVELTGWHRDYARTVLREARVLKIVMPRLGRTPVYEADLLPPLIRCWAVLRATVGRLLHVLVPLPPAEIPDPRTWAEWDDALPGFVGIDLVGHEGDNSFGGFRFALTVTDIPPVGR